MYADIHGNTLSIASASEAQTLDTVILGLAGLRLSAVETADALGETMATVPMAHIARSTCYMMAAEASALPELRRSLSAALALSDAANERELMHMRALNRWADRDFTGAAKAYCELSSAYPRDLLALQAGHQAAFFTGHQTGLRDGIARALPYWSVDMAGHGYVLGMLAFGLEECGEYEAAADAGCRAVSLDGSDSWAAHAVAHCHEMEGKAPEGISWLNATSSGWAEGNVLAYHNWWHLGLFHFESCDWARVIEIYDTHVARETGAPALELVDASALLWRLWLAGVDIGNRADVIADAWDATLGSEAGYYAFNDFHAAFARVAAGRIHQADDHIAALEVRAGRGASHDSVVAKVGLPLVRAIYALGAGDAAGALDLLERARGQEMLAGGSNAQRDVFAQTLMAAAERAGSGRAMQAAAAARLVVKPHSAFAKAALKRARRLATPVAA